MPELPEVEVCRQGISPHILKQTVTNVIVRNAKLRWPIPDAVQTMISHSVHSVERRSKYLLIKFSHGTLVLHLGMSGTIRVIDEHTSVAKHDHFDLVFAHGKALRLNDPRRFGAVLWFKDDIDEQGLLSKLGPEPFHSDFNLKYMSCAGVKALKINDITQYYGQPYPLEFYPPTFQKQMLKNMEIVREKGIIISQEVIVLDMQGNDIWFLFYIPAYQ